MICAFTTNSRLADRQCSTNPSSGVEITRSRAIRLYSSKLSEVCNNIANRNGVTLIFNNKFVNRSQKRNYFVKDDLVLSKFVTDIQDVVTCFTRSHILRAKLVSDQNQRGLRALVKQGLTRWCSLKDCAQSLLDSEKILLSLVSERDFSTGQSRRTKILREHVKACVTSKFRFFC